MVEIMTDQAYQNGCAFNKHERVSLYKPQLLSTIENTNAFILPYMAFLSLSEQRNQVISHAMIH